jgi:PAS domain S-box-containing protein
VAHWTFFTNHLHVLTAIARQPDLRLREIAREVGITERATHRIINDLVDQGFVRRSRIGARNRYEFQEGVALPHPLHADHTAGEVVRLLAVGDASTSAGGRQGGSRPEVEARGFQAFRDAFLAAPAGIAVADQSGRFLAVNPGLCRMLGYSEAELLGRNVREVTHPDDVAADNRAIRQLASGERHEYVRDKRYLRKDGSPVWARLRVAASTDATGETLFVSHVVDITEARRAAQALAEAEERFRSAFDNAPIGMALVAPDGRWLKVNRALCELTGYAETALLVRTFQSITHPADLDTDLSYVEEVLAGTRRTYQMEKRYYHAAGHVIWVSLSVSLVRDASGQPLYFISQIEDITERKLQEEALRDQAARLALLATTDPLT